MACITCDHTMQAIVPRIYWCLRCGTLKTEDAREEYTDPKLVHHALSLCEASLEMLADYRGFRRLHGQADPHCGRDLEQAERAVRECCLPPEKRK